MKHGAVAAIFAGTLAIMAAGAASAADTVALTSINGGFRATSGSDQLYGWFFNTSSAISVTALGVGDKDDDGLSVAHDVGIYRVSDQQLLVSATLSAGTGDTLLNGFRYTGISPFALAAGSYLIEMTMPSGNADTQFIDATGETTSSPVSYVDSAFDGGSSLAYPTLKGAFAQGMFGPNFTFTGGGNAIPEPATWALMLMGFGGAGAMLRGRRKALATA